MSVSASNNASPLQIIQTINPQGKMTANLPAKNALYYHFLTHYLILNNE
ncbi:MAG TPA: hypothetical protein PK129_08045 [Cellvibrionaceae bacterium]|nr:hypothetical protein [Cellvibrionaceae bacterium]